MKHNKSGWIEHGVFGSPLHTGLVERIIFSNAIVLKHSDSLFIESGGDIKTKRVILRHKEEDELIEFETRATDERT